MRLWFFILLFLIIVHIGLSLSELLSCWIGNIVGNTNRELPPIPILFL